MHTLGPKSKRSPGLGVGLKRHVFSRIFFAYQDSAQIEKNSAKRSGSGLKKKNVLYITMSKIFILKCF